MVAFKWLDDDGNQQKIFEPGYQYYLDNVPAEDGAWKNSLRTTIFSPEDNPLVPQIDPSTPFRNSTIADPFTRDTTGQIRAYSRPVFYAISDNKILITNHRTYPSIEDECDRCTSLVGEVSSRLSGTSGIETTIRKKHFSFEIIGSESSSASFLSSVWSDATPGCNAVLYTSEGRTATWTYEYGLGWSKKGT
jgi:hypothetical protein